MEMIRASYVPRASKSPECFPAWCLQPSSNEALEHLVWLAELSHNHSLTPHNIGLAVAFCPGLQGTCHCLSMLRRSSLLALENGLLAGETTVPGGKEKAAQGGQATEGGEEEEKE